LQILRLLQISRTYFSIFETHVNPWGILMGNLEARTPYV
jgi:hypothetical protein